MTGVPPTKKCRPVALHLGSHELCFGCQLIRVKDYLYPYEGNKQMASVQRIGLADTHHKESFNIKYVPEKAQSSIARAICLSGTGQSYVLRPAHAL